MATGKTLVTLVGVSGLDPSKGEVKVGDTLYLEKEPSNTSDPNAIRVYLSKGGEPCGYVGNKPTTAMTGTKRAAEVQDLFRQDILGVVLYEGTVTFGNSRSSKSFAVELKVEETKIETVQEELSVEKTLKFKLVGSLTQYANKFKLSDELKSGTKPIVKLFVKDDKIVAEYQDGLAGYVDQKNQGGISDYIDIMAAIGENGVIAKITDAVATNYIGQFTVNEAELTKGKRIQTLKAICSEIIDKGLTTAKEIEERVSYMEQFGVTEKQMIRVFSSYKMYDPEIAARIPLQPETLYQDTSDILMGTVGYVNARRNMMFEGDKGVGKNVLTETLAWLYKRPLYEFSMNSQHDNNSLLGGKTIESDDDGKTKMGFDLEATIQAAIVGGILVFDEFNTSLAHAMSIFNSLLDDRRRIQVPGYGLVKADDNFFAIAAQNRDYQGTFENNEATADRFVPIIFPKLKSLKEILLARVPQVGLPVINKLETLYKGIKKCVEDGEVSDKAITIRGFIDSCLAMEEDIPLKRALIDNVANRCNDLDDREAIATMIRTTIA